jgi:hypothetical protein
MLRVIMMNLVMLKVIMVNVAAPCNFCTPSYISKFLYLRTKKFFKIGLRGVCTPRCMAQSETCKPSSTSVVNVIKLFFAVISEKKVF